MTTILTIIAIEIIIAVYLLILLVYHINSYIYKQSITAIKALPLFCLEVNEKISQQHKHAQATEVLPTAEIMPEQVHETDEQYPHPALQLNEDNIIENNEPPLTEMLPLVEITPERVHETDEQHPQPAFQLNEDNLTENNEPPPTEMVNESEQSPPPENVDELVFDALIQLTNEPNDEIALQSQYPISIDGEVLDTSMQQNDTTILDTITPEPIMPDVSIVGTINTPLDELELLMYKSQNLHSELLKTINMLSAINQPYVAQRIQSRIIHSRKEIDAIYAAINDKINNA